MTSHRDCNLLEIGFLLWVGTADYWRRDWLPQSHTFSFGIGSCKLCGWIWLFSWGKNINWSYKWEFHYSIKFSTQVISVLSHSTVTHLIHLATSIWLSSYFLNQRTDFQRSRLHLQYLSTKTRSSRFNQVSVWLSQVDGGNRLTWYLSTNMSNWLIQRWYPSISSLHVNATLSPTEMKTYSLSLWIWATLKTALINWMQEKRHSESIVPCLKKNGSFLLLLYSQKPKSH